MKYSNDLPMIDLSKVKEFINEIINEEGFEKVAPEFVRWSKEYLVKNGKDVKEYPKDILKRLREGAAATAANPVDFILNLFLYHLTSCIAYAVLGQVENAAPELAICVTLRYYLYNGMVMEQAIKGMTEKVIQKQKEIEEEFKKKDVTEQFEDIWGPVKK